MPRRSLSLLLLCPLLAGCWSNFYEVDQGRFYRSAQLGPRMLEEILLEYGIRTVINLRGTSGDHRWYRDEVRVCKRLDVALHDISMSSRRIPHRENLRLLLELYETAELPILVHCAGGADRSGLASALWAMEHMGRSKRRASRMLAPRFLHFPMWSPPQRYFLDIYEGEEWAFQIYDPCLQDYEYYPGSRYRPAEPAEPADQSGSDPR